MACFQQYLLLPCPGPSLLVHSRTRKFQLLVSSQQMETEKDHLPSLIPCDQLCRPWSSLLLPFLRCWGSWRRVFQEFKNKKQFKNRKQYFVEVNLVKESLHAFFLSKVPNALASLKLQNLPPSCKTSLQLALFSDVEAASA